MSGHVNRSFSPYVADELGFDDGSWDHFSLLDEKNSSWDDLIKKRLVVIVGEPRMGKTYEFENRAKALADEGQAAFFIPLNMLSGEEGFRLAIDDQRDRYDRWLKGTEAGFFFLDAIDESRLISTVAFTQALIIIRKAFESQMKRVSLFISSRIPDWNIQEVRTALEKHILKPLNNAECSNLPVQELKNNGKEVIGGISNPDSIKLEVFKLNPLSTGDAKSLAGVFGAIPVDVFWQQIEEGGYEFLAGRPGDLKWLADHWKQQHALGTYSQILEAALKARSSEKNQSYIDSSAILSQDQIRQGAEKLAAACIFSGNPHIRISEDAELGETIAAVDVLPNLTELEHRRLLGAALFNAATYGRFSFHHRTFREYLAACWVDRQIADGLPINHALTLFVQSPYGQPVLIRSRRSVFCWLASLNTIVRQRLIRYFPEMLMFEGDPQCWSADDVIEAFEGYIGKLEAGYKQDWWNEPSESIRVVHMIPSALLEKYLSRHRNNPNVLYKLLILARDGKVESCADIVFELYREISTSERDLIYVLNTLSVIAKPAHKAAITDDLLTGRFKTNKTLAALLEAVGIESLNLNQLLKIFSNAEPEDEYGDGPLATAIKYTIIPKLSYTANLRLLSVLMACCSHEKSSTCDAPDSHRKQVDWVISCILDGALAVLQHMGDSGSDVPPVLINALLFLGNREISYHYHRELKELREELEKKSWLRQHLALKTVISSRNRNRAIFELTNREGLVYLAKNDLPWLTKEASRADFDATERAIWYEIAREIALFKIPDTESRKALRNLIQGPDAEQHKSEIEALLKQRTRSRKAVAAWELKHRKRAEAERQKVLASKAELLKNIDEIRSGTWFNAIRWLIEYAKEHNSNSSYTRVNTEPIYRDFGAEIGDSFTDGLVNVWHQVDVPNPSKYLDNTVPWSGIVGLAGVNYSFTSGQVLVEGLSDEDVERAVKLNIWGPDKHEPWFDELATARCAEAVSALMSWFESELEESGENTIPRAADLILSGPDSFRSVFLDRTLSFLRNGEIGRESLERKIIHELIGSAATKKIIADLAFNRLTAAANAIPPSFARKWYTYLASSDFSSATQWIRDNSSQLGYDTLQLASVVAEALENTLWTEGLSGVPEEIKALVSLFHILKVNVETTTNGSNNEHINVAAIKEIRERIPGIIKSFDGKFAHFALQELIAENTGTKIGNWLLSLADEHASNAAEREALIPPGQLKAFGEVYTHNPQSTDELFDQVMARLEEIREGVEHGPFSDRVLLTDGLQEKHLQLWLAARLNDTPRRRFNPRFGVCREPQVDDDKRTDIEISSAIGKVSIEIKPIDSKRKHTATTLVKTLREQLVKKYLHGGNCSHGVLVLFQMSENKKKWLIPGGSKLGTFEDLVLYLKLQGTLIASEDEKIKRLTVLGINCIK